MPNNFVVFIFTMLRFSHKYFYTATCIVYLLMGFQETRGQKLSFNSWTTEAGLSQNSVYAICQDKYGFIWAGTENGLNRFDGRDFKRYSVHLQNAPDLEDNSINNLLADDNLIWIGTGNKFLVYDIEKNEFRQIILNKKRQTFNIYCLFKDRKRRIWAATDLGLYTLSDRKTLTFEKPGSYGDSALFSRRASCIFEDSRDNLWVGSNQGLTRISATPNGWQHKTFTTTPENASSLSSNIITTITEDKNHNIWVGTRSKGINLFNPEEESFTRINTNSPGLKLINNNVRVINADSSGNIWVGTQEGISRINWQLKTASHYQNDPRDKNSLSQNSVHSIFIDRNQFIWIGTFFGGINLINPFPSEFRVWQNNGTFSGLSNNVVSSIASDLKGNLWIGTEGGGINYYNKQTKTFSYFTEGSNSIGSNLIKTIFRDKDGNIWIGTHAGGLNLYQNGSFKKFFQTPENPAFLLSEISTIAEDTDNNLWLGLQGGIQAVHIYKRNGSALTDISSAYNRDALKGRNIKKIFPDSKNNVWIATSKGLFIVPNGKKTVQEVRFSLNNIAAPLQITCLQEDRKSNIWFGIEGGGVNKYSPATKKIYTYRFNKEGKENDVLGILEDNKGLLWISTGDGLIKMDPATVVFQSYTKADALPSNAFNYNAYYKDDDGIFYFGGYNGLISFNPSSFFPNNTSAPIVFTDLKTLNQTEGVNINPTKSIRLKYNQNVFTIKFALLNYIKPDKNRYAYILKGFDGQWKETDNPSVTYMNLNPGKYTLAVKGANNDGRWSSPKELSIIVLPPFWKTWWAYLFYIILFSTILFFIVRFFYLKELLKKEDALHQSKLDFFTNVTHEIRTHLTLIMSPVDKMISDRANDNYLQQQFQNIKRNADNLLRLSEELMDFRKAETENLKLHIAEYDIVGFIKEIYEHFTELSLARNMHISFTHDIQSQQLYFDKEQLEKVFFNLIINAFKFTPDGGHIQVHIEDQDNYVKVSVTDSGRGIAPEYKDKLFSNFFQVNDKGSQNKGYGIGLALSKKIVTLHGAQIEVDSRLADEDPQERRTTFAVLLKKGIPYANQQSGETQPRVTVENSKKEDACPAQAAATEPNTVQLYMEEKNLSILIVDDNPDIRNAIHEILSDKYNVVLAEGASAGWAHATEQIPDLIISDVMMPVEDGFSFCNRLKSDLRTCHIPVILLTAKTTQQDHIAGLDKGADLYLTKPFNQKILELNVRNLLATRERIRENLQHYIQNGLLQTKDDHHEIVHTTNELDAEFLKDVLGIIEKFLDDPSFNVATLSQKIGMSVPVLYKKMKAVTNLSVNDFIKSVKLQKAAELLQQKNLAVYEVCYAVGYQDRKHFSLEFKKKFGKTPKQYALSYPG